VFIKINSLILFIIKTNTMDEQLLKAATDNFNLPHDVVGLPTGGIFYKNKKKSIKVGYLTANDENILIDAVNKNSDSIIYTLLRNNIYEHDLRPDELIESDVEAILLFLRNTSFGPEYNIKLTDPSTGKLFDYELILDELNIKKGTVLPDENGVFTTKLPRTGANIKLKPLTYGETREINKRRDSYPPTMVAPIVNWRLEKQIIEIDGNNDIGFISNFVTTLPIGDSKYIRNFLSENTPSLDLTKQVYAPSGELVTASITFGVEFFRPFF
jgi:hypothetical protein